MAVRRVCVSNEDTAAYLITLLTCCAGACRYVTCA